MIDAYEIGIQLLLQDDVTAGLAVINRGLAEVDRAIAATSADLAGLVREAEKATKAVAAAASGRPVVVNTNGQKTDVAAEQLSQNMPKQSQSTPVAAVEEKASAPGKPAAEPVMEARPKSGQQILESAEPALDPSASADVSSAPVKATAGETVKNDRDANTRQSHPEPTLGAATSPIAPVTPSTGEAQPRRAREDAPAEASPRGSVSPRATPVAMTASVSREQKSITSEGSWGRPRPSSISSLPARRERPVAPWSGVDHSGTQAEATRMQERAAAPQSAGRNQAEPTGGTVMLDGRLVGQWLSEHMGREASRPPAGTNFFDPRQTPAWNVAGAL